MKFIPQAGPWVVYRMNIQNRVFMNATCSQNEWNTMELAKPGYHTLVQSGIASESDAEKLARGTSGDLKSRHAIPASR